MVSFNLPPRCPHQLPVSYVTEFHVPIVDELLDDIFKLYGMTGERPKAWLPLAECWFNTTYHSATHLTPYEAVYG